MSEVRELPRRNLCQDQASEWIARLDRGLSAPEEQELRLWLAASADNYSAFTAMARLWDRMDALSKLASICPEPTAPARRGFRYALPVAATVLLGAALAFWFGTDLRFGDASPQAVVAAAPVAYETAVGEKSTFRLQDGTQIVLNTNSRVSVRYTGNNRYVYLERGEIHVHAAHDSERPLSVIAAGRVVQAIGTEFNIEITSDQRIELVVTEGAVKVGVFGGSTVGLQDDRPLVLVPTAAIVRAGEEVLIAADDESGEFVNPEPIDSEDIAVKLSWQDGNLIFRGESLEDAMSEVGRYTSVEFVFLDEKSKRIRVAGLFKAGDVDGLLAALRQNFNISYEWMSDDKIALSGE